MFPLEHIDAELYSLLYCDLFDIITIADLMQEILSIHYEDLDIVSERKKIIQRG